MPHVNVPRASNCGVELNALQVLPDVVAPLGQRLLNSPQAYFGHARSGAMNPCVRRLKSLRVAYTQVIPALASHDGHKRSVVSTLYRADLSSSASHAWSSEITSGTSPHKCFIKPG